MGSDWPPDPAPAPTAPPAPPDSVAAPEPVRRRWLLWLTVAAASVVVASVGAAAWVSYTNGQDWKERASEWEARAGSFEAQLVRSEADARSLQGRLDDLANEKAQAQDERNTAETQRDRYEALATLAADAAVDVARCQNLISEALRVTLTQLGTETPRLPGLEAMVENAEASCATAEQSYQEFAGAVDAL